MSWCKHCGQFNLNLFGDGQHVCPPRWRCWSPTYDQQCHEGARPVFAHDAQAAAARWAELEEQQSADYPIAAGSVVLVCVQADSDHAHKEAGRRVQLFVVEGCAEPVYQAAAIDVSAGVRHRERSMLPHRRGAA